MYKTRIRLLEQAFPERETLLVEDGNLRASLFTYETGVRAVKLENSLGHLILLPFRGQQIWDAHFGGRSLKMRTSYEAPKDTSFFLDTYGCFMMHCGILSMGNPAEEDRHPHHGELPYVRYDEAHLVCGKDHDGRYIALTGSYDYNRAFGDHYRAIPCVKLYEDASLFDISMQVTNLGTAPMEYMYLCHVNYAPEDGSEIFQTLPWTRENMAVRSSIPSFVEPNPSYLALLAEAEKDVAVTRVTRPEDIYDPELVFFLRGIQRSRDGLAHFMYRHPDGTADYVSFDPEVLDHGVRWMVKHPGWQSMGLVLPATAEPEGYHAEKAKGYVRTLAPGGVFECLVTAGWLDAEDAETIEKKIQEAE